MKEFSMVKFYIDLENYVEPIPCIQDRQNYGVLMTIDSIRNSEDISEILDGISDVLMNADDHKEAMQDEDYWDKYNFKNYYTKEETLGMPHRWQDEEFFCQSCKDITIVTKIMTRGFYEEYKTSDVVKILKEWKDFLEEYEKHGEKTKPRTIHF